MERIRSSPFSHQFRMQENSRRRFEGETFALLKYANRIIECMVRVLGS